MLGLQLNYYPQTTPLYQIYRLMKIVLFFLLLALAHPQTFQQFKQEMEDIVFNLTTDMRSIFQRRCQSSIASCSRLSYYQCQGTAKKKCYEEFPKPDGCLDEGAYLAEGSAVRFPPEVNAYNLTDEEKQFICTSAFLEESFEEIDAKRNSRYGRFYIGTNLGSFRSYPATGGCSDYDPRFRPWYVAATAGAKNVILILDVSGSMSGSGISLAKDAAISVVNTLSNSDFVGVVKFESTASYVYSHKILRGTQETKDALNDRINGLKAQGGTNYELGFRYAMNMLSSAEEDEFGPPCPDATNIVLFLTDGHPNEGTANSEGLKQLIDNYGRDIILFTYALGPSTATGILQELSCANSGIMFEIRDSSSSSQLATKMKNYYSYIAKGLTIEKPVWTEPYYDAFGLGRMVTVSMPIYYQQSNISTILGVAGLDVNMASFQQFGLSDEQLIRRLIEDAPCHRSNLSECEIDGLRQRSCDVTCPPSSTILKCSNPPANIFLQPLESTDHICCGLAIATLVVIVVLPTCALIVIFACVVRKCRKSKEQEQEKYRDK